MLKSLVVPIMVNFPVFLPWLAHIVAFGPRSTLTAFMSRPRGHTIPFIVCREKRLPSIFVFPRISLASAFLQTLVLHQLVPYVILSLLLQPIPEVIFPLVLIACFILVGTSYLSFVQL